MNWEHLRAFLWLRGRLRAHQSKKTWEGERWIQRILRLVAILAALLMFGMGFAAGLYALGQASALVVMLVWDGIVVAFLFLWMIELQMELQQTELLSMNKFLHLPVSPTGVFLINYLGSMTGSGLVVLLPAMIGLSVGLVASRGPVMLWMFPMLAAFSVMTTALTFQFRGWLASLMANQRRRRTIVALAATGGMILFQLPNLMNMTGAWRYRPKAGLPPMEEIAGVAAIVNMIVPLGWLPYGAMASFQGKSVPPFLVFIGLSLIGWASLRRSYRTTLRLYTGDFTSAKPRFIAPVIQKDDGKTGDRKAMPSKTLLEWRLPWVSEQVSAVALMSFRSLTRAPESKMMLFSPLIMTVIFGSMFLKRLTAPSEFMRPVMAAGAMAMICFGMLQVAGNLFGFDRSGFRAFVLASASRKDILLGKNLSLAPLALGYGSLVIAALQWAYPMSADHFFGALIQMVSMYLLFCLFSNSLSILGPVSTKPGSFRQAKPQGTKILLRLAALFLMFPLILTPTLIPLGLEYLSGWFGWPAWVPVYLIFALIECAAIFGVYAVALAWQGNLLHRREQRILEIVTAQPE